MIRHHPHRQGVAAQYCLQAGPLDSGAAAADTPGSIVRTCHQRRDSDNDHLGVGAAHVSALRTGRLPEVLELLAESR
jgi:hypothetical protein